MVDTPDTSGGPKTSGGGSGDCGSLELVTVNQQTRNRSEGQNQNQNNTQQSQRTQIAQAPPLPTQRTPASSGLPHRDNNESEEGCCGSIEQHPVRVSRVLRPHTQGREGDRVAQWDGGDVVYSDPEESQGGTDGNRRGCCGRRGSVGFASNVVITSKYTWYNFIFKNLFLQFQNVANIYFLLIGILQIIPQTSTTNSNPTMYQTLGFIVIVSAIRAGIEDYGLHKADERRNRHPYKVLRGSQWVTVASGDLRVGDLVRVSKNDMIPADMVLLSTAPVNTPMNSELRSDPLLSPPTTPTLPSPSPEDVKSHDAGHANETSGSSNNVVAPDSGQCYIDKANLNGETTLEVLTCVPHTKLLARSTRMLSQTKITLTFEPPTKHFDSFRGILNVDIPNQLRDKLYSDNPTAKALSLQATTENGGVVCSEKVLLMRETNLRNTEWIVGMVVYTGGDTKIERSNAEGEKPKDKKSFIMRSVDRLLIVMLLAQTAMCATAGLVYGLWVWKHADDTGYLMQHGVNPIVSGVLAFFSWFILLAQMVPISLIVSAELVKFTLSRFIQWDRTLYSPILRKAAKCNTSTVHEDLGQVSYIFSDKTGTLTQNKMEFRYAALYDRTKDNDNDKKKGGRNDGEDSKNASNNNNNNNTTNKSIDKSIAAMEFGSIDTEIARSVRRRTEALNRNLEQKRRKLEKEKMKNGETQKQLEVNVVSVGSKDNGGKVEVSVADSDLLDELGVDPEQLNRTPWTTLVEPFLPKPGVQERLERQTKLVDRGQGEGGDDTPSSGNDSIDTKRKTRQSRAHTLDGRPRANTQTDGNGGSNISFSKMTVVEAEWDRGFDDIDEECCSCCNCCTAICSAPVETWSSHRPGHQRRLVSARSEGVNNCNINNNNGNINVVPTTPSQAVAGSPQSPPKQGNQRGDIQRTPVQVIDSSNPSTNNQDQVSQAAFDLVPSRPPPQPSPSPSLTSPVMNVNEFTEAERQLLLNALWGPAQPGESPADVIQRRSLVRRAMTHMALSNTVTPFMQDGELKFQSESAEELAMCNFAMSVGFTKKKHPDGHVGRYILEVLEYDESLNPSTAKLVTEVYAHVATFGFTSKRARVTVIYEVLEPKTDAPVLVMSKGQDSVILPLLAVLPDKDKLVSRLSDLCTNGLRTLVCGHASHPLAWWADRASAYEAAISSDDPQADAAMYALFEQYENEAKLEYLGALGLEDQLQPLVPECIADCLSAGIKVWMITGDKLETAKNIGLACNLIDPDMLPSLKADASLDELTTEFSNARLLEITGQWASLAKQEAELRSLFKMFDSNNDGYIDASEIATFLDCMHSGISAQALYDALTAMLVTTVENEVQDPSRVIAASKDKNGLPSSASSSSSTAAPANVSQPTSPLTPLAPSISTISNFDEAKSSQLINVPSSLPRRPSFSRRVSLRSSAHEIQQQLFKDGRMTEPQFVWLMKRIGVTAFDAVLHDIQEAIAKYCSIEDPKTHPVSLLVDRDAFIALFPGKQQQLQQQQQQRDRDQLKAKRKQRKEAKAKGEGKQVSVNGDGDGDGKPGYTTDEDDESGDEEVEIKGNSMEAKVRRLATRKVGTLPSEDELEELRRQFFLLAAVSKSVVFARAQPAMKKKMVTEIQARVDGCVTLAIGDGANDADMIKAAHIGVGIAGVEGTAATNASDYALGTFRMLHTLLFVHGFWSSHRVATLVYFIFYKASLLAFTGYLYGIHSSFSGQQFYNDPILQLYNIVFTALPIIVLAIWDQPLPAKLLENAPQIYRENRLTPPFTGHAFLLWVVRALAHGAFIYFVTQLSYNNDVDLMTFSTAVYFQVSVLPNVFIFFCINTMNLLLFFAICLTLIGIFLGLVVASLLPSLNPDLYGVVLRMFSEPIFWLITAYCLTIPVLFEMLGRYVLSSYSHSLLELLRQALYLDSKLYDQSRNSSLFERTKSAKVTPASPPSPPSDSSSSSSSTPSAAATIEVIGRHTDNTPMCVIKTAETFGPTHVRLPLPEDVGGVDYGLRSAQAELLKVHAVYNNVIRENEDALKHANEAGYDKGDISAHSSAPSSSPRSPSSLSIPSDGLTRSHSSKRKAGPIVAALSHTAAQPPLPTKASLSDPEKEASHALSSRLLQTLLRFRRMTGSTYDSAAQAKFQQHSRLSSQTGPFRITAGKFLPSAATIATTSSNAISPALSTSSSLASSQ